MKPASLAVALAMLTVACHSERPVTDSQADTRVRMFLEGKVNFVNESDLAQCRPELREMAWQKLD